MQILSRTGPSVNPWGTPLITGLQPFLAPLITRPRAQAFSQASTHLSLPIQTLRQQLLCEDLTGGSVKGLLETQADDARSSPTVCQGSCLIT